MRILHICKQSDIRAFKQAVVMLDRGHQVELATPTPNFYGFNAFTLSYLYTDADSLKRIIENSRADVIHVHSDPNWLVCLVRELAPGRVVVHDVHDPESMRTGQPPTEEERRSMTEVNGIIHVSEGCRKHSEALHGNALPTIVSLSAVPAYLYGAARHTSFDSLVYQGGLTTSRVDEQGLRYFRNLLYVVERFIAQGYNVSLFAAGEFEIDDTYQKLGAFLVRHVPYAALLTGLRQHGFGFVGAPLVSNIVLNCMPNKLFEYLSQGVVPVCWNADEAGRYVTERGIGIHLQGDLVDLRRQLREGPRLRERLLKTGRQYAMENEAPALEQFYKSFI